MSGVLTFDPHPSRIFRPTDPTRLIMPIREKCAMLHQVGVEVVVRKHFDQAFAAIPAGQFLAELKQALPALCSIYVGENFRFGQKRAGDVATLIQTGNALGLGVFSAARIKHNGEPISSTRIRADLEAGRIESANDLLGYNYFADGLVVEGARLGRQLGFPTLNLPWQRNACHDLGSIRYVYACRLQIPMRVTTLYQAGRPPLPTLGSGLPWRPAGRLLEVHVLESTSLTAGDAIEVEWLKFIRPEQKFASVDALRGQIAADIEQVRDNAENG